MPLPRLPGAISLVHGRPGRGQVRIPPDTNMTFDNVKRTPMNRETLETKRQSVRTPSGNIGYVEHDEARSALRPRGDRQRLPVAPPARRSLRRTTVHRRRPPWPRPNRGQESLCEITRWLKVWLRKCEKGSE